MVQASQQLGCQQIRRRIHEMLGCGTVHNKWYKPLSNSDVNKFADEYTKCWGVGLYTTNGTSLSATRMSTNSQTNTRNVGVWDCTQQMVQASQQLGCQQIRRRIHEMLGCGTVHNKWYKPLSNSDVNKFADEYTKC